MKSMPAKSHYHQRMISSSARIASLFSLNQNLTESNFSFE